MNVFRCKLEKDKEIPYHHVFNVHHFHVFRFGFHGAHHRRGFKSSYYARCKKAMGTGIVNTPFIVIKLLLKF